MLRAFRPRGIPWPKFPQPVLESLQEKEGEFINRRRKERKEGRIFAACGGTTFTHFAIFATSVETIFLDCFVRTGNAFASPLL
jgi:hypothetical protein